MSDGKYTPITANLLIRKRRIEPSPVVLSIVPTPAFSRTQGPDTQEMPERQFGLSRREHRVVTRNTLVEEVYKRWRAARENDSAEPSQKARQKRTRS